MPSTLDEDYEVIEDDDGGTEVDSDICVRADCEHERGQHEEDIGACIKCKKCKAFKEP
jgi:hypothetical protein